MLGFTSVYREGFETVLFLQALVLEGGIAIVVLGTLIGLAATMLIGLVIFRLQVRLPYKRCRQHRTCATARRLDATAPHPFHHAALLAGDVVWPLRHLGRDCTASCGRCLCNWQLRASRALAKAHHKATHATTSGRGHKCSFGTYHLMNRSSVKSVETAKCVTEKFSCFHTFG